MVTLEAQMAQSIDQGGGSVWSCFGKYLQQRASSSPIGCQACLPPAVFMTQKGHPAAGAQGEIGHAARGPHRQFEIAVRRPAHYLAGRTVQ
jgi:hypothetical protein